VIVSVPVRLPAAVGVKVTEIVQPAPAATVVPQVFVSAKSPEAVIDVMDSPAVPELVSVTVCASLVVPSVWAAKVRLVVERVTEEAELAPVPVPLRGMLCVAFGLIALSALSVSTNAPLIEPEVEGAKLTRYSQEAPEASEAGFEAVLSVGQVVELPRLKFVEMLALFPEVGAGKFSAAFPMLSTTTSWGLSLLVEPTAEDVKLRLGGVARLIFRTVWSPVFAIYIFPSASKTIPRGLFSPVTIGV
jgi:hypothetical protein